ncbi:hypothetical protein OH76DRAFT_1402929 [Lentinus brumalis]|uniref:Uncharacterized protein n=1 Tax=Lentinus brumalis TaxID=2498619 RepID=A0A371DC22_9APHY|nr:hypothetical protein OH76DRAFT_1402929 [Polyporus brumalis]
MHIDERSTGVLQHASPTPLTGATPPLNFMHVAIVAFATFVITASLGVVHARPRVAHATSDCSRCTVTYAPPMTFTRTVTATVTVLPERKRLSSLLQLHAFNLRQEGATDMTTTMDTVTTTAIDTLP